MRKMVTYDIWPRDIRFERKLVSLIDDLAVTRGLNHYTEPIAIQEYSLGIDRFQRVRCSSIEEFLALLERTAAFERFECKMSFAHPERDRYAIVGLSHYGSEVEVMVDSRDIDLVDSVHTLVKESFGLRNVTLPLRDEQRARYLQPTVFVGRPFDEVADRYFGSLSRFLKYLGFEVKQGEQYASQPIPEKVKARIDAQDTFIALVCGEGEHPWLVAEPSYALGKGKHIVLLLEEGTRYDPTIMGRDLEQIRFPHGHIEKTFIPLLQEFHSLRVGRLR